MRRRTLLAAGLALVAGPAFGHSVRRGALAIGHAWALPSGAGHAEAFVPLALSAGPSDALVGAETPAARRVAFRRGNEIFARVEIAPGRGVPMRPGALHLRLEGLTRPVVEGDRVPATLIFERAGRVEVEFWVEREPYGGGPPRER